MRVAQILAETLTEEERKLLIGLSSSPMPADSAEMQSLSSLRLVERELCGTSMRVTPFGANVIAVIRDKKRA